MSNPFKYGEIVGKENFCNRKSELRDVKNAMVNGDRLILFSERRIGKTSLVQLAMERLPKTQFLRTYVDFWPTLNEHGLAQTLAIQFSKDFSSTKKAIKRTAQELFGHLRPEFTFSSDDSMKISFTIGSREKASPELLEILKIPSRIAEKQKKRVVVVFDEIQQLFEYENDYAERALRSAIQSQPGVAFILLGSRKHVIQSMVHDRARPLYRAGTIYPLSTIAAEHWLPFIRERFYSAGKQIDDETILDICRLTEGHPYYTQHLCHALWDIYEDIHQIEGVKLLERAFSMVLHREHSAFVSLWESLTKNQKYFLCGLAIEGPRSKIHHSDFIQKWGLKSSSNVQRIVTALQKNDIIDQDNGSYFISDRFFLQWIRREEYQF